MVVHLAEQNVSTYTLVHFKDTIVKGHHQYIDFSCIVRELLIEFNSMVYNINSFRYINVFSRGEQTFIQRKELSLCISFAYRSHILFYYVLKKFGRMKIAWKMHRCLKSDERLFANWEDAYQVERVSVLHTIINGKRFTWLLNKQQILTKHFFKERMVENISFEITSKSEFDTSGLNGEK